MNSYILSLILFYSSTYNIDPMIAMKVIAVESDYNIHAKGSQGEVGLLQLKPSSFPGYSTTDLYKPEVNIKLGIRYLAECKKYCVHQANNTWLICFNAGVVGGSRYKYPRSSSYMRRYYE